VPVYTLHGSGTPATLAEVKTSANTQSIEISQRLESWYARDSGEALCTALRQRLQPLLDRSFGYHVAQLGPLPGRSLIDDSPINHRIFLAGGDVSGISARCHADELPLESDSVDMLLAFHALEFEEHPHASLREMHRVLRPSGHLALIGFNPFSLLGVSQYLRGFRRGSLWQRHNPVSPHRLLDWLHLLDCQLESMHYLYPVPLFGHGRLRRGISRFDEWALKHQLPGGGVYMAHAIKQIAAVRPRMRRQRVSRALSGLAVAGRPQAAPRHPQAKQHPERAA
jgi:SAM-dependent methyltransferase